MIKNVAILVLLIITVILGIILYDHSTIMITNSHKIIITSTIIISFVTAMITSGAAQWFGHYLTNLRQNKSNIALAKSEIWAIYGDIISMLNELERIDRQIKKITLDKLYMQLLFTYVPYSPNIMNSLVKFRLHPKMLDKKNLSFMNQIILAQKMWMDISQLIADYNEILSIKNVSLSKDQKYRSIDESYKSIEKWLNDNLLNFRTLTENYRAMVKIVLPDFDFDEQIPEIKKAPEIFNKYESV